MSRLFQAQHTENIVVSMYYWWTLASEDGEYHISGLISIRFVDDDGNHGSRRFIELYPACEKIGSLRRSGWSWWGEFVGEGEVEEASG